VVLHDYLSYVNANIVLSNKLKAGFHDWTDFLPFYRRKFLSVGQDLDAQKQIDASNRLFEVSFPEFAISDTAALVKVLNDKRIIDLRRLIQDAVEGKVTFDEGFARNMLKEVLGTEKRIARYRTIVSYLTMPLDFLPLLSPVAQKVTEEVVGMLVEKRLKQKYRWFYMLSDAAEGTRRTN
jgi:hypothetical protein